MINIKPEDIIIRIEKEYNKMWKDYKIANEVVAKAYIEGYLKGLGFTKKLVEKMLHK